MHSRFKNKDRAQPLGKLVSADTSKAQEHRLPHCCFVLQYFHYQLHSAWFPRQKVDTTLWHSSPITLQRILSVQILKKDYLIGKITKTKTQKLHLFPGFFLFSLGSKWMTLLTERQQEKMRGDDGQRLSEKMQIKCTPGREVLQGTGRNQTLTRARK